jgi:hypothetical protein
MHTSLESGDRAAVGVVTGSRCKRFLTDLLSGAF